MKKSVSVVLACLIAITSNSAIAHKKASLEKKQRVLEVVIFSVKESVSSKNVYKLAHAITPILEKYHGFVSRQFAQSTKGKAQYIDLVKWRSLKDADYAAKNIVNNPKMKQFVSVMRSYKMYHFR